MRHPLLMVPTGKLGSRRPQVNAVGGLTFILDEISGSPFLADTGASVSVLPYFSPKPTATLKGADGKGIPTFGTVRRTVRFGGRTFDDVLFTLAAVDKPILGADFFASHRLLVDSYARCIRDAKTLLPLVESTSQPPLSPLVSSLSNLSQQTRELLSEFPSVIGDGSTTPKPLHGVQHTIETTGRPVFAKSRRLDSDKLRSAESEFRTLEGLGIVRRSDSPWSSPLHMVAKPDGTWRPCGDYRRLNTATVDDRYALPSLLDFSAKLSGCTFFTCIDLVKGYHPVPMAEADIPKTAIITPFGLFEYVFMPFGLKNAAQTFQRLMDRLFRRLPFVFTYLDDNLIASASLTEHWTHLRQFLLVMAENGLQLNPAKCVFAATSLKFLGHRVDTEGVTPLPKNVETIESFPAPSDVKGLQRFLGMVNFYRRFMPGLARIVRPLTDLLRGSPPPKSILWSQEAEAAFVAAKAALAACSSLTHPRPDAVLSLSVDASDSHVGGVLQQLDSGSWRPLAFFSKKLSSAEEKYSTFDRELLAAYSAIRHFRYILEGRAFRLYTDHKPLVAAISRVTTPLSGRQQRHLSAISEFTTDVRYCPGPANVVADALSRPALTPPPFQAAPVQTSTIKNQAVEKTTIKPPAHQEFPPPQVWPELPPHREPCNAGIA